MKKSRPRNLAASVRARLLNLAKSRGDEFQYVLTRYDLERWLYRLSRSPYHDCFVLKGAMLFEVWGGAATGRRAIWICSATARMKSRSSSASSRGVYG